MPAQLRHAFTLVAKSKIFAPRQSSGQLLRPAAFPRSLPDRRFRMDNQMTIKSLPTMISPLKCFAAGARQVSSLMLSIAGVRCDSTRVLTPASCAMRPTSSTGV